MKRIILIFFVYSIGLFAVGPKKFVKEGWNYCRNRESHPGRQCCFSVSKTPSEIPMLGAVNSNIHEILGYGFDCTTTCECNTLLPEFKCNKTNDCVKIGPYFKCNKGKCKFPCLTNDDCNVKFGKGFICNKKFCEIKPKITSKK